MIAFTKVLP